MNLKIKIKIDVKIDIKIEIKMKIKKGIKNKNYITLLSNLKDAIVISIFERYPPTRLLKSFEVTAKLEESEEVEEIEGTKKENEEEAKEEEKIKILKLRE